MTNDSSKWVQLKLTFPYRRGGIMPGSVYPTEARECVSCLKTGRWLDAECSYCKKAKARLKGNR